MRSADPPTASPARVPQRIDAPAVARLYALHADELRRRADRLLGAAPVDVEDVLHDLMVRLLRQAAQAPPLVDDPAAWLHACVRNACLSELRRDRRGAPPDALGAVPSAEGDPAVAAVVREQLHAVTDDLGRLPARQRRAIVLSAIDGRAHGDIAGELAVTESAITMLVSRARRNLAALREARETPCTVVMATIDDARRRGVRTPELVRRHRHACVHCRAYGGPAGVRGPAWLQALLGALVQRAPEVAVPAASARGGGLLAAALAAGIGLGGAHVPAAPPPGHAAAPPAAAPSAPAVVAAASGTTSAKAASRVEAVMRPARRGPERRRSGAPTPAGQPAQDDPPASPAAVRDRRPTDVALAPGSGCARGFADLNDEDRACREAARLARRAEIRARVARHEQAAAAAATPPPAAPPAPAPATVPEPEPPAAEPVAEPPSLPAPPAPDPGPGAVAAPAADPAATPPPVPVDPTAPADEPSG